MIFIMKTWHKNNHVNILATIAEIHVFCSYIIEKGRLRLQKSVLKIQTRHPSFFVAFFFLRNSCIFRHWEKTFLRFTQSTLLLNTVLPIMWSLSILNHNLKPEKQQRKQQIIIQKIYWTVVEHQYLLKHIRVFTLNWLKKAPHCLPTLL